MRRTLNLIFPSFLALIAGVPVLAADFNSRQTTPGSSESVNVIQTSFVPRVITNVIEMRVPTNVFITLYRTNQFEVLRTNVFEVYRTNLVRMTRTNIVELSQTNMVTRYQTNVNTLTLTNWETVLVFKTNRFTQPVTNLVQVDLPASRAATVEPTDNGAFKYNTVPAAQTATPAPTDGYVLEAARTAKPAANGQAEITLKLKSVGNEPPAFVSQEWQVQRTDNSVLLFGRGPEFKRELPLGAYKVDVKARVTASSPLVRVRRNFEVTRDDVIQQKPAGLVNAR